jgi:hypothetical protein
LCIHVVVNQTLDQLLIPFSDAFVLLNGASGSYGSAGAVGHREAINRETKDLMAVERREATAEGWVAMDMLMLWTRLRPPWNLLMTLLLLRSAD